MQIGRKDAVRYLIPRPIIGALLAFSVLTLIATFPGLAACLEDARARCMVAACVDEGQVPCLADAQERCSEGSQKRYNDAQKRFTDGKFREAANMGEATKTSESLALAAEALALYGHYHERDDKQTQFQRGKDLAERAITLNPCNSEAHLQYAHTLGRIVENKNLFGQFWDGVRAKFEAGDLHRMNDAFHTAKRLDPKNARACVGLATFHAAIVAHKSTLFDANRDDVLANYECALENAPDSNVVHLAYAKALWLLDQDKNVWLVRQHLDQAIALDPKDTYGKIVLQDARMCLNELNNQGTLEQCMKRT